MSLLSCFFVIVIILPCPLLLCSSRLPVSQLTATEDWRRGGLAEMKEEERETKGGDRLRD